MSNLPNDDALPNFDRPIESGATKRNSDPTRETYLGWSDAYDFFNEALFGGELPPCLITYQRSRKFYGYFAGDRFIDIISSARLPSLPAYNVS